MLAMQRMTFGGLTVSQTIVSSAQATNQGTAPAPTSSSDGDAAISFTPLGNELRLDGTLYHGLGQSCFDLQDDRSRISVNWAVPGMMQGLLRELGVPLVARGKLIADLRNYQTTLAPGTMAINQGDTAASATDTHTLAHHPLLTPYQLLDLPAWRPYLDRWTDESIGNRLTMSRSVSININTAPVSVMQALPGVDASEARRVIALREEAPLASETMAYAMLPSIPDDSGLLMLYPSNSGTLTTWPTRDQPGLQLHYTLTPFNPDGSPWRIDYVLPLAQPPAADIPARHATGEALLAGALSADNRGTDTDPERPRWR
jgi:hypothetical protein